MIVGRGATWFLRDRDDAFHAFLYAPYDEKMRRCMATGRESRARPNICSIRWIASASAFVRKYYGKIWPDRSLYNLMMNTIDGDGIVVDTILDVVGRL